MIPRFSFVLSNLTNVLSLTEIDKILGEQFVWGVGLGQIRVYHEHVDLEMSLDMQWRYQVSSWICQFGVWERSLSSRQKIGSCSHKVALAADGDFVCPGSLSTFEDSSKRKNSKFEFKLHPKVNIYNEKNQNTYLETDKQYKIITFGEMA